HAAQAAVDARRRRSGRREVGGAGRTPRDASRADHPQAADRRASAGLDGAQGRDELRRPPSRGARLRRGPRGEAAVLCRASHGQAGHYRLGSDQLPLRCLDRGCAAQAGVRSLLRQELHALPRPADPAADAEGHPLAGGSAMIGALGSFTVQLGYLLCAAFALALSGWSLARRGERGPAASAEAGALALTACWAIAFVTLGVSAAATAVLLSLSHLAWLWTLYRLFAHDDRDKSVAPIRPVVLALGFVELMQLALLAVMQQYAGSPEAQQAITGFAAIFRLLFCVGALVLVHNLYAGAGAPAREALRWPAAALATIWLYDLNLSTVAYLGQQLPLDLVTLRVAAIFVAVALLAIGLLRHDGNLRFHPSRSFAFRSASLLIIGAYLAVMVLLAQGLAYAGGKFDWLVQASVVALAAAVALTVWHSRWLRGWLRVTLSKHLFQHRYDYRAEWLRFTETMGRAGASAAPLRERIVQAAADITDSPGGLLLTPREEGGLGLDARWQWPGVDVPAEALGVQGQRFFEDSHFILDLDDMRSGRVEGIPAAACPEWLRDEPSAWAMVPLLHYERLVGLVVLSRPPVARRLDWEDFDLLRVVSRQLASYLAEQASQDALGE